MRALYILLPVLAVLALAYRYYSAFIATRIMCLDDSRKTPAHTRYDGHNFYPTTRWAPGELVRDGPVVGCAS